MGMGYCEELAIKLINKEISQEEYFKLIDEYINNVIGADRDAE
jgi:hypothetical protein